jgi:hypothetical protein
MPTGYTEIVDKGCSFDEYVWRCARAFGALIMMRDNPSDDVPERVPDESEKYHERELAKAKAHLAELEASDVVACKALARLEHETALAYYENEMARSLVIVERQKVMRERVESWEPPTPDHAELKEFMLNQLEVGKECTFEYLKKPDLPTPEEWKALQITEARRNIAYHTKVLGKCLERQNSRQGWVDALRSSVPQPTRQP